MNEIQPLNNTFHEGHRLVGAVVWATSRFFHDTEPNRWKNSPLPGVQPGGMPVMRARIMIEEDIWLLLHIMRDAGEGLRKHIGKTRRDRRISRAFHYWKTAAQSIVPEYPVGVGSTDKMQAGASDITLWAFKQVVADMEAWGLDAAVEAAEGACRRFVQNPDLDDILMHLPYYAPGQPAWDVEVIDAVMKILAHPEIESHEDFVKRERQEMRRAGKHGGSVHGAVQIKPKRVDVLSTTMNARVDALGMGSSLDEQLKEALMEDARVDVGEAEVGEIESEAVPIEAAPEAAAEAAPAVVEIGDGTAEAADA